MPTTRQATIDAMNNGATLSKPIFLRLNSVGDVVTVAVALQFNALAAEKHGEPGIAARSRSIADQVMAATPDDWDCGDPDCESCAEAREERAMAKGSGMEPLVQFLRGPQAGDA